MRQHRRCTDIAKARVEHVRAVRRGLEPRRHDVARGDLSRCSGEEVLSEGRVAVAGRPNRCGDRRTAGRMRELATGRNALPLQRAAALKGERVARRGAGRAARADPGRAPNSACTRSLGSARRETQLRRMPNDTRSREPDMRSTSGWRRRHDRPRGRPPPRRRRTQSRRGGPGLPQAQRSRFAPCSSNVSDPSPGRVT